LGFETDELRKAGVVAAAVADWAAARFGTSVIVVSSSSFAGGLDNYVHAIRLSGDGLPAPWREELVVRIAPDAARIESALTEMSLQNWVVGAGFPAARVLAVLADDWALAMPAQISVRAPGRQLLEAVKSQPTRVVELIGLLANLHADLHELPTAGWPTSRAVEQAATWRFNLVRARVAAGDAEMAKSLRSVEQRIEWCRANPVEPTVCHGDFHPLNVVFDGASGSAVVVDWTDGTLDDPYSDIARTATLFRCAAIAGGSAIERVALAGVGPLLAAGYVRAYNKRRKLDKHRLQSWESLHLLNGWAQLCSLQDSKMASSASGQSFPPWLVRSIRARLRRTLRRTRATRRSGPERLPRLR
jgi:aminoglycoside phosphotransferase (APT) family kinase protein